MSYGPGSTWSATNESDDDEPAIPPPRAHPVLIVIAVVGCLHLFFLLAVELDRNLVQRREVARLESEVAALNAELDRLVEIAAHGEDSAYREVLARKQGFVYPDESLLVTGPE